MNSLRSSASPCSLTSGAMVRRAAQAAVTETLGQRADGRALLRPVRSARFNAALRASHSYAEWRRACGEICRARGEWDGFAYQMLASKSLRTAFARGAEHGWPKDPWRPARLRRATQELEATAFALSTIMVVQHASFAANEMFASAADMPEEAWSDVAEQQVFERWKAGALRRRIWPGLPSEEVALLVRPVAELVFHAGLYLALQARWRAARPGQVLWRFRPGAHCRRHDADAGLTAPPDHPVWTKALPPRAHFCDCWIEVVRARETAPAGRRHAAASVRGDATPVASTCSFFAADRREGARGYLVAYAARMQAECTEDDEADCGSPLAGEGRPAG